MRIVDDLAVLNRAQWATFIASVLGWTLDAFDFFLMVFGIRAVAHDFNATIAEVSLSVAFTLMFRPFGALFFGWLAEKFGRRPILMIDILLFAGLELASAFAPSLPVFLVLRALFGFAMGGEWGIGASLVMESIPARSRGTVSGFLQQGYPLGYLLASLVYGLMFDRFGWRGMFIVGVAPALLVVFIRLFVEESPVWQKTQKAGDSTGLISSLARNWKTFFYVVLLMTAFNFFSHGTQDLYPTFLQVQHKLPTHTVSIIVILMNVGAIIGGLTFGFWSQQIGRKRAIIYASLLALPIIPLWAFSTTPVMLGLGAFLLQIAVQGAWGVIPAHLNELSPRKCAVPFPALPTSSEISLPPLTWLFKRPSPRSTRTTLPSRSPSCSRLLRWRSRSSRPVAARQNIPCSDRKVSRRRRSAGGASNSGGPDNSLSGWSRSSGATGGDH